MEQKHEKSQDIFNQRKKAILEKKDKSSIGEWDEKVKELCNKINSLEDFYTTSSCSGRVVLMIDQEKKGEGLFLEVSHEKIDFNWLKNSLEKAKEDDEKIVKFKTEPPILHIACKDLDSASNFLEKAKHIGFKRSGINVLTKNIILELCSTEKIEFPIIEKGRVLVDDNFLRLIIKKSNEKLERGWEKIDCLRKDF
jgi:tRNA wybutosine-synthesizing protein 3